MHYKMEWIYTQTKISDQGSLCQTERKNEEMQFFFYTAGLVQAYLIVSMDVWGLDR
jgi:hypothetical protein